MEKKPLPKRKSPRLPQYDYGQCGYYFVTICTKVRNRDTLGSIIPWERVGGGLFKSYTDHGYRGLTDKKTPGLWQRGFYDHVIRNDADLDAARRYVRNNPVKKQERESIYAEKETTQ